MTARRPCLPAPGPFNEIVAQTNTALLLSDVWSRSVSIFQLLISLPTILLALMPLNVGLYAVGMHGDQVQTLMMRLDSAVVFCFFTSASCLLIRTGDRWRAHPAGKCEASDCGDFFPPAWYW